MRFGYYLCRGIAQIYFRLFYGMRVTGLRNLPRSGTIMIASNHRSNYDPPILGSIIPREVHFFAKEELFRKPVLSRLIRYLNAFPVRRGSFDRESLSVCLDVLKHDGALIFFPEGTRAPSDGFLKAKLGLGWVAALSGTPVIPVYIHGSAATKLRVLRRPGIDVVFGKPVPVQDLAAEGLRGKELYQQISDRALDLIRELSLQTPRRKVRDIGPLYDRSIIDNERLR